MISYFITVNCMVLLIYEKKLCVFLVMRCCETIMMMMYIVEDDTKEEANINVRASSSFSSSYFSYSLIYLHFAILVPPLQLPDKQSLSWLQ